MGGPTAGARCSGAVDAPEPQLRQVVPVTVLPLCPRRQFDRRKNLLTRLQKHHVESSASAARRVGCSLGRALRHREGGPSQPPGFSLDAMHIVMVMAYDQNTNNKRITGSSWLAVIMNKFSKRHPFRTAASWGGFFDGSNAPTATQDAR